MKKIQILAIVGSFRKDSYNLQLAKATQDLISSHADFSILDYSELPFFNQDLEASPPDSVKEIRQKVSQSDALWFFTPEYNRSYPGLLKNLLDWLSRSPGPALAPVIANKLAAISGVTPGMSGTLVAQEHLVALLNFMNLRVLNSHRLAIPSVKSQISNGKLELQESLPFLKAQCQAFLEFIDNQKRL